MIDSKLFLTLLTISICSQILAQYNNNINNYLYKNVKTNTTRGEFSCNSSINNNVTRARVYIYPRQIAGGFWITFYDSHSGTSDFQTSTF